MRHPLRATVLVITAVLLSGATVAGTGPAASAAPASQATPDPVIIVAGTGANQPIASVYYAPLAARLRADGFTTFIFGLPAAGLGDIAASAAALDQFADGVRASTGAARVDLVGHSQGGLVGRYYIKYLGGAGEVDSMISLGAPHYGTAVANIATFLGLGSCLGVVACQQMAAGSSFLAALNAGDDTIGGVRYTNIVTAFDEIVVPYRTGYLADDGNNTNVTVQTQCPLRVVGHLGLAFDGTVYDGVRDALRGGPVQLNCLAV